MHLYIKDFWEKRGHIIHLYCFSSYKVWFIYSDPAYYDQDGPPPVLGNDIVCLDFEPFNLNKQYFMRDSFNPISEKNMIKMVKMKVFL